MESLTPSSANNFIRSNPLGLIEMTITPIHTIQHSTIKKMLTASQLVGLLKILGALVADYSKNPNRPIDKSLVPLLNGYKRWVMLEKLPDAVSAAMSGRDKVTKLYELGIDLKTTFVEHFHSTQEFTTQEIQLLRAIRAYLVTDSENALNYIKKNAGLFEDSHLALAFAPNIPKADSRALRRSVNSLVGRDGVALSMDESRMLKETDPKGYAAYLELRKAHNHEFKATLMHFVRNLKKQVVPYQEAYASMIELGFTHSMVPGFTGMIDDQGRWYTKDGKAINGVPNLATYTHVVMNSGKDPDQQWVFKAMKADGDASYGYTADFTREQTKSKYQNVRDLMTKIKSIRARWMAKVKKFDVSDVDCVAAVVLEILFSFAARIGSAPGRGAGTLLAKNASITQSGINLAYLGKDSIPTKHMLKDTDPVQGLVIKALLELLEDKKGNDYIFTYFDGKRWLRCTPADVNAAFHRFGAPPAVTVHKLRTCRGTTLFKELVDQREGKRPPRDEKEALLIYKEMTEKVGKLLNHKRGVGESTEKVTGVTAALSYIDADMQIALFRSWGFRVPKHLEKIAQDQ